MNGETLRSKANTQNKNADDLGEICSSLVGVAKAIGMETMEARKDMLVMKDNYEYMSKQGGGGFNQGLQ